MKLLSYGFAAVLATVMLTGCGQKQPEAKVDLNKPVTEIKVEAEKLDTAALQKQVDVYKQALEAKKVEMEALQKKLKDIPLTQMLGSEAKNLKDEIGKLTQTTGALTERLNVYTEALKKQAAGAAPAAK